jgi:hypothetical protein
MVKAIFVQKGKTTEIIANSWAALEAKVPDALKSDGKVKKTQKKEVNDV